MGNGETVFRVLLINYYVKVDNLKAIELMVSPNPKYMMGTTVTHNDWHTDTGITGLYYQQTDAVKASEIYKSGAGAQRLR